MLRLLRLIFLGTWHEHQYEEIASGPLMFKGKKIGTWYDMRCKICGHMKQYKLE